MNLLLSVVGYVCLALATGLGVLWSIGRLLVWLLARSQRKLAAAEKRLVKSRADAVAALEQLARTHEFIETWNLAPAPEPALVKACCKKADPCVKHVPQ